MNMINYDYTITKWFFNFIYSKPLGQIGKKLLKLLSASKPELLSPHDRKIAEETIFFCPNFRHEDRWMGDGTLMRHFFKDLIIGSCHYNFIYLKIKVRMDLSILVVIFRAEHTK